MRTLHLKLALLASRAALRHSDVKGFLVGAAAIRADGAFVSAGNGPAIGVSPSAHAEHRLSAKLDQGAEVLVIRTRRDGSLGCAKPCQFCITKLLRARVAKLFYSDKDGDICRLW